MARNFNTAVSTLTSVTDEQLTIADEQLASAQGWLQGLVETARQAMSECAPPPAKRQRAARSKSKATVDGKVGRSTCSCIRSAEALLLHQLCADHDCKLQLHCKQPQTALSATSCQYHEAFQVLPAEHLLRRSNCRRTAPNHTRRRCQPSGRVQLGARVVPCCWKPSPRRIPRRRLQNNPKSPPRRTHQVGQHG